MESSIVDLRRPTLTKKTFCQEQFHSRGPELVLSVSALTRRIGPEPGTVASFEVSF